MSGLGVHNTPPGSNVGSSTGGSGVSGDGITWPYNPYGQTPDFNINWNSVPPPTAQQVEATYEALVNWLKNNTGSPAFYNGSILLLQMTVDIGQHLGSFSASAQSQLESFLGNQMGAGGNKLFLQMVVEIAAEAAAVESNNGQDGLANATAFLNELKNATQGLANVPPFNAINSQATDELNNNSDASIYSWIFGSSDGTVKAHWGQVENASGGYTQTWLDDEGAGGWDPTINGQQAMTFEQFTIDAQFELGSAITASETQNSGNDASSTINAYYQTQIQSLVAEFKGNPWALLTALMGLINQRDQDTGAAINGYGGTLNILQQANGYIQKMLGDISGSSVTPANIADFYTQLQNLKNLVLNDPALSSVASQLEADIGTINGNSVNFDMEAGNGPSWTNQTSGYYNFPPGAQVYFNGKEVTVPNNGVLYVPAGTQCSVASGASSSNSFSFGQLAAMGDYSDIAAQMSKWENGGGTGTNWSGTVMSNFENGVTGIQTLMNSPSAAIQQEITNETNTAQAEENFMKEALTSITDVNQQVMQLVASTIG